LTSDHVSKRNQNEADELSTDKRGDDSFSPIWICDHSYDADHVQGTQRNKPDNQGLKLGIQHSAFP
jgi:hypothetical protein